MAGVHVVSGPVKDVLATARVLAGAGLVRPVRPDRLLGMALALGRWGVTPAAGYAAAAVRQPDAVALVDDDGPMTFREIDRRSNAVARGLAEHGVHAGDVVGLLARNGADFVLAAVALSKLGTDVLYLNTGFAGPALAAALEDEGAVAVVHDPEFRGLLDEAAQGRVRVLTRGEPADGVPTLEQMAEGDPAEPFPPPVRGKHVILTSGTTGRAKGAARSAPSGASGLEPLTALLGAIPLRADETTVVAAPLFHTWGFAHMAVGMLLGSTLVVSRKFDAERTLAQIAEHRATALVVVPVMLQRILDLPVEVRDRYDCSSLRVVASSGSALPTDVATRFMDYYGDVVYNLYGSTEVAYASVATPADLRAAPGTVGRPPRGAVVRIMSDGGHEVPTGEVGRIFVGNGMTFSGYTGGEDKERVDGLVASGDVGRFDEHGLLYVEGRDDDMVVSGGENVFPQEVEELLLAHKGIADVAVIGVPDEQYGARLAAHVVRAPHAADLDEEEVRDHVRQHLARYKVPRDVVFHDELPRNATGKVLKRELRG